MKIGSSKPLGGSGAVARTRAAGAAAPAGATKPVGGSAPVKDTTSVLGIPEAEFTPKVRAAIFHLLEEVEKLRRDLDQHKQRMGELERLADEDTLVPVANRRAFVRELSRMLSYAQRYGGEVSVLYFDINDMKRINDGYGHAAGDAAIAHVALTLLDSVRESDVVGRLGGDEFGVILANAPEGEARAKAEQLANVISTKPLQWKGESVPVQISYGAYALRGEEDASAMLHEADKAMYARKPASARNAR